MTKRKLLLIVLLAFTAVTALSLLTACDPEGEGGTGGSGGQDELYIYNWEDYIDIGLLDDFAAYYKEQTGRSLDITYTTFDTNETMLTNVQRGGANVDLICPSEYAIEKLMRGGYVENLSELVAELEAEGAKFDNIEGIDEDILSAIDEVFGDIDGKAMRDYMVPYMYGTLGILYNKNIISEEELEEYGWGILWNEGGNPELEDEILLKDSIRDTYCAAVLYLREYGKLPDGVSPSVGKPYTEMSSAELMNCTDDALLAAVEEALIDQRGHISGYEVDFGKDDMINEIVYADLAWSGDALWAIEESYDEETDDYMLGYYVPGIGSNIWYDGWIVPTTVRNKLAAVMFIDYMCRPESAARNIGYIAYTSAVDRDAVMNDADAIGALLDVEYLWYAEDDGACEIFLDGAGNRVFRYDWGDGEPYLLEADGSEFEGDESTLRPAGYSTDEDGLYLDENGEYIVDADAMNLFFFDEARYPVIDETLGVMQDYGAANDRVVQMWERVKAGAETPWPLIWCLIGVVAVVALLVGGYFLKEALKARPRRVAGSPGVPERQNG